MKKYIVSGKEENGTFVEKGKFYTAKEALDLANKLNNETDMFYYDYHEIEE